MATKFELTAEENIEAKIRNLLTPVVSLAELLETDSANLLQSQLKEQVLNNCARLISLGEECDKRFNLTVEEVEIVRFALAKRQYQLGNLLTSWEKEGVDESDKEFEYYRDQYNKEQPILTRINQWQSENQ